MANFNLDDLGNIEVTLKGEVKTVSKYDIDADNKGGFLWLTKPNRGENANLLGDQIIKVTMPFEMFEYCKTAVASGRFVFPGIFEVRASVISGSGLKSGHKAVAIKQIAILNVSATAYDSEAPKVDNPPPPPPVFNSNVDSSTVNSQSSKPEPKKG
jgi:hypothetical protein